MSLFWLVMRALFIIGASAAGVQEHFDLAAFLMAWAVFARVEELAIEAHA